MDYQEIQNKLEQFTGTEKWYIVFEKGDKKILMTDGVKYFVENCGCEAKYLIMDIIRETWLRGLLDEWQFIHIIVEQDKEMSNISRITMYSEPDLNEPHFWDYKSSFIKEKDSMPEGKYKIWFQNNVLLLPSEY